MKVYKKIILTSVILLNIPNLAFSVNAPFTDRMEVGVNGWVSSVISGPLEWELGTPSGQGATDFPLPSPSSCWGTKINGKYSNSKDAFLTSPTISLGSSPVKPFLSFYAWYKTRSGQDGTIVQIYSGGTWNDLDTSTNSQGQYNAQITSGTALNGKWAFTGNSGGWIRKRFELSYSGDIQIRFYFASDNTQNDTGMYVDNVIIGSNLDADRYIRVLPPEPTPVSTSSVFNDMFVTIQVQNLLGYKEAIPEGAIVWLIFTEENQNSSVSPPDSSPPVDISTGQATITLRNTERESVILSPDSNSPSLSSILPSNKISATGKFLSPFIKIWEEKE